jgi:hypothetical protein
MRSMTAGFLRASPGGTRDEVEGARISAVFVTGLVGVSVLPSILRASSRLDRLGTAILSVMERLSKLGFPERLEVGVPSTGLLKLLRPVLRVDCSSNRVGAPRKASLSINPFAVTGATAALGVVVVTPLAIFVRFCMLEGAVLGADAVVMDDAFDDWGG